MKLKIRRLFLQNFMVYHTKTVDFVDATRISGANGAGKSSILTAYMWLLFNCDYDLRDNPPIRREVNGQAVNDMDVIVEATFDLDGKTVTARKVQKRKFSKDGSSYSDDNTYFINDVPKTLRDYNEYFSVDMGMLRLCSNINAALTKKSKELRDFLFSTVPNMTDVYVAGQFDDVAPLRELLEKYTVEELIATNKASKAKVGKEIPMLEGQIKEKERDCTVDIDLAELELQRNALKEQIAETESLYEKSENAHADYQRKSDAVFELRRKITDVERRAADKLRIERDAVQSRIDAANRGFEESRQNIRMAELDIEKAASAADRYEKERLALSEEYIAEKGRAFPEYEELPELSEDALICPACGQELPESLKNRKTEDYEQRRREHRENYEKQKADFAESKDSRLKDIALRGNSAKENRDAYKKNGEEAAQRLEDAKASSIRYNKEKSAAMEELAKLPESPDLSDNQEYESMVAELRSMETALRLIDSGVSYRSQLRIKLSGLREELSICEGEIVRADTTEAERRLEELRQRRIDLEQSKADCERILFLCDELDRHKNDMLADSINSRFKYVTWQLWELNKSGTYKSVCVPMVDCKSLLDISSNKGNRILGKLDICNSIQKITGINCPVFLDDAESLDRSNTEKLLALMDCQIVLMSVTEDKELKVEVA